MIIIVGTPIDLQISRKIEPEKSKSHSRYPQGYPRINKCSLSPRRACTSIHDYIDVSRGCWWRRRESSPGSGRRRAGVVRNGRYFNYSQSGWSTVRETLQRDRAVQSPYICCYEVNSPCRVPWSVVRNIARARCYKEKEYPSALDRHPPPRELPSCIKYQSIDNRTQRSAWCIPFVVASRRSRQPTANPCGISHVDNHSEERSVVREGRQLPSPFPGSDSSR